MPKKINLDIASVEQREQRLGTIIAWDGTTEDLHKQSSYELRGQRERGTGCGGNCRLCELQGPFTQGSVCSEQMVECQAGNVRDAVLIQHAPIGCGGGQVPYNNIYRNGLAMRGFPVENIRIINTIFVASSCATGIIGEDIESITDEKEAELGIPVVLAINMGDLAASSGLAVREKIEADPGFIWHYTEGVPDPVPVLFSLREKNGYQGSRLTRLLVRSQERSDYPLLTDEEFANFRSVSTTGMRPMTLYRSSSPIDPVISRSREAAAAAEAAGIKTIINLSDTEEMMQEQPGYADSYYSRQNVLPLNLTIELSGEDFRAGFARAARFMLAHDGPYLIHCTHGKDRTGFICAILECLTGATLDEVVQDYMLTYGLFYNVIPMTEAYSIIAENNILAILSDAFETDDLLHLDLVSAAEDYLLNIGLTSDELSALRERLQS